MLNDWHVNFPGRIESMFTAMQNIVPSHLCDNDLFDFKSINAESGVINGGDTAFDQETEIYQPVQKDPVTLNLNKENTLDIIEIK